VVSAAFAVGKKDISETAIVAIRNIAIVIPVLFFELVILFSPFLVIALSVFKV